MRFAAAAIGGLALLWLSASSALAAPVPAPSWLSSPNAITFSSGAHAPFTLVSPTDEYLQGVLEPTGTCGFRIPVSAFPGQGPQAGMVVAEDLLTCQYEVAVGAATNIAPVLLASARKAPKGSGDPQQSGSVQTGWSYEPGGINLAWVQDNITYAYNTGANILSVSGSASFYEYGFSWAPGTESGSAGVGGQSAGYWTNTYATDTVNPGCVLYWQDNEAVGSNEGVISSGTYMYDTSSCTAYPTWYPWTIVTQ